MRKNAFYPHHTYTLFAVLILLVFVPFITFFALILVRNYTAMCVFFCKAQLLLN